MVRLRLKRYTRNTINNRYFLQKITKKRRKLSKKYAIFGIFNMQLSQSYLRVTVV